MSSESVRSAEVPVAHPEADLNAFEGVTQTRSRPGYRVEPVAIGWNAVVFALKGSRDAIACIPRPALGAFVDDLDAGRLDDTLLSFLATPPAGRVLRNSDQTTDARLFDTMESPSAIAPPERVPGRLGRFGGRGTPTGSRPHKRARRSPRLFVAAAVVVVVLVGGGIAIAARGGSSKTAASTTGGPGGPSANPTTPPPTAAPAGPDLKVDVGGSGFLHIAGTFCGGTGQGHFDLTGSINGGGLPLTVGGEVDLTIGSDGTGTFSGHMDLHPPAIAPIVNQIAGNAKVNRFDGTEAEIELFDGGPGAQTIALPPSRVNPAHKAIPATSGVFC